MNLQKLNSFLKKRRLQLLKTYGKVLTEPVFITKPAEKGKVYQGGLTAV